MTCASALHSLRVSHLARTVSAIAAACVSHRMSWCAIFALRRHIRHRRAVGARCVLQLQFGPCVSGPTINFFSNEIMNSRFRSVFNGVRVDSVASIKSGELISSARNAEAHSYRTFCSQKAVLCRHCVSHSSVWQLECCAPYEMPDDSDASSPEFPQAQAGTSCGYWWIRHGAAEILVTLGRATTEVRDRHCKCVCAPVRSPDSRVYCAVHFRTYGIVWQSALCRYTYLLNEQSTQWMPNTLLFMTLFSFYDRIHCGIWEIMSRHTGERSITTESTKRQNRTRSLVHTEQRRAQAHKANHSKRRKKYRFEKFLTFFQCIVIRLMEMFALFESSEWKRQ